MATTDAVTVLVLVGAGSRYEWREISGLAHFTEHMFFKGAKRYPTTKEVAEAIDSVGGEFNAFTAKEYAGYYVRVASEHLEVALDVLSDMLLNATFAEEEIERERGVILEEYNMYLDTPASQVSFDFERHLFGDQPLGWEEIGTLETIKSLKRDHFLDYRSKLYTANNTVISIAGAFDEKALPGLIGQYFTFPERQKSHSWVPFKEPSDGEPVFIRQKSTEQAHLAMGVMGYPEEHEDYYTARLIGIILGGNMSSRMFLSVRERQGLAYYVNTASFGYTDAGLMVTKAGVDLERVEQSVVAIRNEYLKLAEEGLEEAELKKAKDFFRGRLTLQLENSMRVASLLGVSELLYQRVKTPREILEKVERVTRQDVARVAGELLEKERLKLAIIGPFDNPGRFAELLKT
jgi:predicted Zn-dependent peptidase